MWLYKVTCTYFLSYSKTSLTTLEGETRRKLGLPNIIIWKRQIAVSAGKKRIFRSHIIWLVLPSPITYTEFLNRTLSKNISEANKLFKNLWLKYHRSSNRRVSHLLHIQWVHRIVRLKGISMENMRDQLSPRGRGITCIYIATWSGKYLCSHWNNNWFSQKKCLPWEIF